MIDEKLEILELKAEKVQEPKNINAEKYRHKKITERTLRIWRKEALQWRTNDEYEPGSGVSKLCSYILQMTQELLDLHLINKI